MVLVQVSLVAILGRTVDWAIRYWYMSHCANSAKTTLPSLRLSLPGAVMVTELSLCVHGQVSAWSVGRGDITGTSGQADERKVHWDGRGKVFPVDGLQEEGRPVRAKLKRGC